MSTLGRDPVTLLLEAVTTATWERLRYAERLNVSQGEETITDINLLSIARFGPPWVQVLKCPKHLEAQKGIDWDLIVGSRLRGWRRYAVQAKRASFEKSRPYKKLNHHVEVKSSAGITQHVSQLSMLNNYAHQRRAVPIYCLYNYTDKPDYTPYWQCCTEPVQAEQLGCTVTPASVIDWAIHSRGKRNFDAIHQCRETIPFRCVSLCPRLKRRPSHAGAGFEQAYLQHDAFHEDLPWDLQPFLEERPEPFVPMYNEYRSVPKRVMIIKLPEGD